MPKIVLMKFLSVFVAATAVILRTDVWWKPSTSSCCPAIRVLRLKCQTRSDKKLINGWNCLMENIAENVNSLEGIDEFSRFKLKVTWNIVKIMVNFVCRCKPWSNTLYSLKTWKILKFKNYEIQTLDLWVVKLNSEGPNHC